jgi:hypothetical protein
MHHAVIALLLVTPCAHAIEPTIIAEGAWSKPVADGRGRALRGRLVLAERRVSAERREIVVCVELQDASEAVGNTMHLFADMGRHDFRPEYKGGLRCQLRDKDGKELKSTSFPFGGAVPQSEWVSLPPDATIRLRATPFGIHRPGAMAICPDVSTMWVINDGDPKEYFLSGTFAIDPAAERVPKEFDHVWRGTLELPAAKIVNAMR